MKKMKNFKILKNWCGGHWWLLGCLTHDGGGYLCGY
jgi:hypothetical protein